eukprot:3758113-Amphidinium_carterae.1
MAVLGRRFWAESPLREGVAEANDTHEGKGPMNTPSQCWTLTTLPGEPSRVINGDQPQEGASAHLGCQRQHDQVRKVDLLRTHSMTEGLQACALAHSCRRFAKLSFTPVSAVTMVREARNQQHHDRLLGTPHRRP